ncbi:hypothetical protein MPDQ_004382 [Monascus purpureus]|uniref:alcohol dehydrogenase n=1 Tax=Monascus purpureus TaxID=5098 RepID=A0A507QHE4_MONPU|nr:hypothetical protein MPDQ_004382 [Monascus purpureus]
MSTISLPQQQRAVVREGSGDTARAVIKQVKVSEPGPGQILVKINWTGLCGSDKALLYDEWTDFGFSMLPATHGIAGHEGVGVVVAVGSGMERRWKIGDRAGIKWIASVCGECEFCLSGTDEVHCIKQLNSGFSAPGSFQEYCLVDGRYTSKIPDGVTDEEAAPILCGGVTAYSACKRSGVKTGQWIALIGAGGGLGHLAIQYARAMGMRVIAIDGGDEKQELCTKLGAEAFIDFQKTKDITAEVMKITTYGVHGVIVTAASKPAYDQAVALLRPKGTVVVVGLPKDATIIAGAVPMVMAMKQLKVVGSVVGSLNDVKEALDLTARDLVHPILTKGRLEEVDDYVKKMAAGQLAGRVVLKVAE